MSEAGEPKVYRRVNRGHSSVEAGPCAGSVLTRVPLPERRVLVRSWPDRHLHRFHSLISLSPPGRPFLSDPHIYKLTDT